MPKQVHDCVKRLLADPNFNPDIGKGKTNKTKEEIAWAICTARYKKETLDCQVCEIDNDELFQEAIKEIMDKIKDEKPVQESYTLEGINIDLFKEAISEEDLKKINKFSIKPVESKDVTVFTALLIDDKITRNNTRYNKDFQDMLLSLPPGEGNFVGAPILFGDKEDHQHAASAQVGRIFDAWQVVDSEKHFGVMAKIYILNETNEDLISKINSGVLKELSISTKVELPICSICGQNIMACDHTPGQNGCHIIMSGKGFVAEASFVAVPGSNAAKILNNDETKNYLRLENLKDLVTPMINEAIHPLTIYPSGQTETMNAEIELLKENYTKISTVLDEISKKMNEDIVQMPIDTLSTIKQINEDIDGAKEFVIRNLAKFDLPISEFRSDVIPDLVQGLKGEEINFIIKLLYDNLEILGINLSKIEEHLKVNPKPTNQTFTGDINNVPTVLRFMSKKIDSIKTRINKLQGRFDLEELQRKELITEAIKMGIICGKFNFSEKNLAEKFFDNFTTEEIKKLKEEWFEEGSSKFTPKEIEVKEIKDEKEVKKETKTASLKEIAQNIVNGGKNNG